MVARRTALSSLMLYDLRSVLAELEGGPPIRTSRQRGAARRRAAGPARARARSRRGVKEKRKGPIGRAAGLAEGVAATVRRMQRDREPRVLLYDSTGYARLLQPDGARLRHGAGGLREHGPHRGRRRAVSLVDPELAGRVLARALAHGGDLAELYAEDRQGFALSLDEGRVEAPQSGREAGVCVRVVQGESTYYGHVDGLAEPDLMRGGGLGGRGAARARETAAPVTLAAAERATRAPRGAAARRRARRAQGRAASRVARSAPAPPAPRSPR